MRTGAAVRGSRRVCRRGWGRPRVPLHHPADGPPPRAGEDWVALGRGTPPPPAARAVPLPERARGGFGSRWSEIHAGADAEGAAVGVEVDRVGREAVAARRDHRIL